MEVTGIAEDTDDLKKNQTCPFPLTLSPLIWGPSGQRSSWLPVLHFSHPSLWNDNSSHTNFYQWLADQHQHSPFNCCIYWSQHLTPHRLPGFFPVVLGLLILLLSVLLAKIQNLYSILSWQILNNSLMVDFGHISLVNNGAEKKPSKLFNKKIPLHLNQNKAINYFLNLFAIITPDTCNIFSSIYSVGSLLQGQSCNEFCVLKLKFSLSEHFTHFLLCTGSYWFTWLLPLKLWKPKHNLKLIHFL